MKTKEEEKRRKSKTHTSKESEKEERRRKEKVGKKKSRKKRKTSDSEDEEAESRKRGTTSREDKELSSTESSSDSALFSDNEEERREKRRKKRSTPVVRKLLEEFPNLAGELWELLHRVDAREAVDIHGIPDKKLRKYLKSLFAALDLKRTPSRAFILRKKSPPCLPLLEGEIRKTASKKESAAQGGKCEQKEAGKDRGGGRTREDGWEGKEGNGEREREKGVAVGQAERKDVEENGKGQEKEEEEKASIGPPARRVVGPAMPSTQQLEAAAKLTEALEALRGETADELVGEGGDDDSFLIGPIPAAAEAEAANATEAERFEHVLRILDSEITAYDILGVNQDASSADLKKRYMKVSLLVHPDKCRHPQAPEAFKALNKALKELQDPSKRAAIDAVIEKKKIQKEYEADLKARKEAAEWRRVRGEPLPDDEQLLSIGAEEKTRDEWMTELPPEHQARMATKNTFFSAKEKTGRGDVSGWTDTPQERAEKAKKLYLEAYSQAMLTGPDVGPDDVATKEQKETAALLDAYNCRKRGKSLFEVHQEKLEEAEKEKRKKTKKGVRVAEAKEWRMWDREKDLEIKPKSMSLKSLDKNGGLGSRFGSDPGQRNFL